jgi:dTDP-4-dehydrorhamnose reductase
MKVLITGANGFLGQHLTIYLQQQGFNVVSTNRGLNRNKLLNELQYESLDLTNEYRRNECITKASTQYYCAHSCNE